MLTQDDLPSIVRFHKITPKIPREDRSKPKGKRPWRDNSNGRRYFFE